MGDCTILSLHKKDFHANTCHNLHAMLQHRIDYPHEADDVPDTSTTQFFSDEMQATSNMSTQKDQHVAGSRQKHWPYPSSKPRYWTGCSPGMHPVRSAADDANMFSCPLEDCTQPVTETVQRRIATNSIIVMGRERSTFHTCYPTSPFGSHGPVSVRATSGHKYLAARSSIFW